MTEQPPIAPPGGSIEPVDLQLEMQRSYLDYAMSVIVGRALPEVRDGLKPVHRRVLYAMYDGGYRPDRGYNKCSRVVGDVMGQYHPHGDSAIYDTLVRLAQPWALRYPLVDGQGNFGSPGNDRAAAMRYCVTGDTRVRLADGSTPRIDAIMPGALPNSDHDVELKVLGRSGEINRATKLFHSGGQRTLRLLTDKGYQLTGSTNHPVLTLGHVGGVPLLLWKRLDEISTDDRVVLSRIVVSEPPYDLMNEPVLIAEYRRTAGDTPEGREVLDPLVDGRFYYASVTAVEDAGVRPVYSLRVDSADHAFITDGFVSHNTECRMASLAMEMVRDIDEETVDFQPNYDGKTLEPLILPSRFPNLLVNGSAGIAVGMATNIPPHNLREVADGVQWYLHNPEASAEELLAALMARISGPDFPTGALVLGKRGIEDAYRTGRGSITMRAIVEVEEIQNRTCLVVTELPYQVNPDNLALKIAELVKAGKIAGVADVRDESSGRTGQRLVIVLRRDAVAKVVLNNLYKHTQLQDNFGANMLALVDGVPRTLPLDGFVRHWVEHQLEVIQRRTRYRLRKAEEEAHILRGYLKALDALDAVIALIRASATVEDARDGLIDLLEIDEIQATAILNMQLRRLAALERQKIIDRYDELMTLIEDYNSILASPERQRTIVGDELTTVVEKYGDERRTRIVPFDGDMSMEDLIPQEEVVVTITRGGYAKRTRVDQYRSQRRGGKGVRGAQLRGEDVVDHFFTTTTHDWLLFFTNLGRVYRAKAYELPEAARDAKGQHVANLLAFQPGEQIAQVLDIKSYEQSPYLVLATKRGLVKKTRLTEYDSNRTGGLIAVNLRESEGGGGDEVVSARLVSADNDLLLVSRKGMSVRFTATDEALRPMGRATSGVTGMKFRAGDELLAMDVVSAGAQVDVFVVFENGLAKRTPVEQYRPQGRGGLGIKVAKASERGGDLVGALTVTEGDEVLVVMEKGKIVRSRVDEVRPTGRDTSGVRFAAPDPGDAIIAVARNPERALGDEGLDEEVEDGGADGLGGGADEGSAGDGAGEGAVQARSAGRSDSAAEAADGVPSSVEHESNAAEADEPD